MKIGFEVLSLFFLFILSSCITVNTENIRESLFHEQSFVTDYPFLTGPMVDFISEDHIENLIKLNINFVHLNQKDDLQKRLLWSGRSIEAIFALERYNQKAPPEKKIYYSVDLKRIERDQFAWRTKNPWKVDRDGKVVFSELEAKSLIDGLNLLLIELGKEGLKPIHNVAFGLPDEPSSKLLILQVEPVVRAVREAWNNGSLKWPKVMLWETAATNARYGTDYWERQHFKKRRYNLGGWPGDTEKVISKEAFYALKNQPKGLLAPKVIDGEEYFLNFASTKVNKNGQVSSEPNTVHVDEIGKVNVAHEFDRGLQLGEGRGGGYLRGFRSYVNLDGLAYDDYPFRPSSPYAVRSISHFGDQISMEGLRGDKSGRAGIAIAWLQAAIESRMRDMSESEFNMQASIHLAKGFQSLWYWKYRMGVLSEGKVSEPPRDGRSKARSILMSRRLGNVTKNLRVLDWTFFGDSLFSGRTFDCCHSAALKTLGIQGYGVEKRDDTHINTGVLSLFREWKLPLSKRSLYFMLVNLNHHKDRSASETELEFWLDFRQKGVDQAVFMLNMDPKLPVNRYETKMMRVEQDGKLRLRIPGGEARLFKLDRHFHYGLYRDP